jgi:hypothetical protein
MSCFCLIGVVGGGVQLGPLGNAAANSPIVPAPGDYHDGDIGGMIDRGNRSTRRKPGTASMSCWCTHTSLTFHKNICGGQSCVSYLNVIKIGYR